MIITHKYRIYPTKAQITRLENQFSMCRYLYNWALADRIWLYENHGVSISRYEQINELVLLKEERPWFASIHSQVLQNVLVRLDLAYQSFFGRVKKGGEVVGFPKFKKFKDWNSITYPQFQNRPIDGVLKISKIGNVKIKYVSCLNFRVDFYDINEYFFNPLFLLTLKIHFFILNSVYHRI